MKNSLPVLIVGAGPVGLSLALALSRTGVLVEVFEADAGLNAEIRASTFHPRTLEMFSDWGVVDGLLARGHQVSRLQYWEREPRRLVAEFDYSLIAGDTPFPFRLQCPQHIATRVLKPAVEENAPVHMAHRLIDLEDLGDRVRACFETPGGKIWREGAFLCGADGSRSTTRELLGLGFEGMTYEDRFLLAGTDLKTGDLIPGAGPVLYIFDPEEWVIILNLPDLVRIVFRLKEHEDAGEGLAEPALRRRIANFFGETPPYKILASQLYRVHQRVADSFRQGRVLLLGDAAHINNPAGGMGMNSGIHDAGELAKALPHALTGANNAVLDTWAAGRRKFALDAVQAYTDRTYRDMVLSDPAARMKRNRRYAELQEDPEKARAFLLQASMLEERI